MLLLMVSGVAVAGQENVQVYVTWEGSEPDKGASAWLIKRFIDPEAKFLMLPIGSQLPEGFAFDVPESRFRRTHRSATYQTLQEAYQIDDPIALRLGVIIHDIEINTWRRKIAVETPDVLAAFDKLLGHFDPGSVPLDCQVAFFDGLYAALSGDWPRTHEQIFEIPTTCESRG